MRQMLKVARVLLLSLPPLVGAAPNIAPAQDAPKQATEVVSTEGRVGSYLQFGVFSREENAETHANAIQSKFSMTPSVVGPISGRWHVVIGPFETMADALVVQADITDEEVRPIRVAIPMLGNEGGKPLTASTPMNRYFLREANLSEALELRQNLKGHTEYERLEQIEKSAGQQPYRAELERVRAATTTTDDLRGYIDANLGSIAIREGNNKLAEELLGPVARGEVAAAYAHRVMAMRRYSWAVHQNGDRLKALKLYRELEGFVSSPAVKATCQVEIAGLLMELAESGKGEHREVREHIMGFMRSLEDSDVSPSRATMELMYLETYARQNPPEYLVAAQLGEQFIAKYGSLEDTRYARDLAAAYLQTGLNYMRRGHLTKGESFYLDLIEKFPVDVESFAGHPPHAEALLGLGNIARLRGDLKSEYDYFSTLVELYPTSHAAGKAIESMPQLRIHLRTTTQGDGK